MVQITKKNITLVEIRYILQLKEKEDPEVSSADKRRRNLIRPKPAALTSQSESVNEIKFFL